MTEIIDQPLTFTAFVSKKVADGNYGSDEVGLHVQVQLPAGTDPASDEAAQAARDAINAAKVRVWDALGVPFEIASNGEIMLANGTFQSRVDATAAAVTETSSGGAGTVDDVPAEPPHMDPAPRSDGEKANTKWAARRFAVAPDEFWDNRPVEGKRPTHKHKQFNRTKGWQTDVVTWVND